MNVSNNIKLGIVAATALIFFGYVIWSYPMYGGLTYAQVQAQGLVYLIGNIVTGGLFIASLAYADLTWAG